MKPTTMMILMLLTGSVAPPVPAQSGAETVASEEGADRGVPLRQLIETVAKTKVLVDPRVTGSVHLYGQDPARLDYEGLLSVLALHGYAAYEESGYLHVIPDAGIRQQALPVVSGSENLPPEAFVTTIFWPKSIPATDLVPILRPLVQRAGHLAALPCRNAVIMVDTLANVRRLKTLIQSLDTGTPLPVQTCTPHPLPEAPQGPGSIH